MSVIRLNGVSVFHPDGYQLRQVVTDASLSIGAGSVSVWSDLPVAENHPCSGLWLVLIPTGKGK